MARRFALAILALACLGGGVAWWLMSRPPAGTVWQGYAEADYVKIGPVLEGRLTSVSVSRGSKVEAGSALFTQDDVNDRAARDQAARQLAQAKEQLANLIAGGKPTEIQQAEGNLADAEATLTRAKLDFERRSSLAPASPRSKPSINCAPPICLPRPRSM